MASSWRGDHTVDTSAFFNNSPPGTDSEYPFTWDSMANAGFALTALALIVIWGWAITTVSKAGAFGLVASVPVIVVFYFLAGLGFSATAVALKRWLMPKVRLGVPIKLFSPQFAAWWLVNRFVDINNILFMRNFRGTIIVNYYYTLLGAKVAESAFVDTLDVVDFDSLEIGDKAAVGEGTTIIGHNFDKDGNIVFNKVRIGDGARVNPFALVTPDIPVKAHEELKPLAKASTAPIDFSKVTGLSAACARKVSSPSLSPLETALYQVVGVTVPMTVSILAAFLGCATFETLMPYLGTPINISGAYATTAFITLSNPFLVIFALLFVPVEGLSFSSAPELLPACLTSFAALPVAFGVYALALVVLSSFAKHVLVGSIEPGLHKRNSKYGVAYWVSQRLVDNSFNNVGAIVMGTWALNSIYRLFGATVGAYSVLRKSPSVTVPDMLKLGKWVVGGDTCKIATSMPVDSSTILSAPITVEDQGTIGASAVLLPGTTVAKQATLAPLTIPEAGSSLAACTIYMGAPPVPVKVEARGDAGVEIPLPLQAVAIALPYVQMFSCLWLAVASHIPAVAFGVFVKYHNPGILGQFVASYFGVAISSVIIGRLNNRVQAAVGKVEAGQGPVQWSFKYFIASANAAVTFYCACFGDALWKGSPDWVNMLRRTGLKVGRWVYLDSEWIGEPGLIEYGDHAVADRGAIVFGHLMTHNGKEFALQFNKVTVGPGAVVNARSALMPGVTVHQDEHIPAGDLRMAL